MKALLPLLPILLCGCSYSKAVPGAPYLRVIHIGGVLRPGATIVVPEGTNAPPTIFFQASGSPILPSAVQMSGMVGAAATLGATLRPDHSENNTSTTTLIRDDPPSPPIPSPPSRPPFGPPPWHGSKPGNKGH